MKLREGLKKRNASARVLALALALVALPCLVWIQSRAATAIDTGRTDCQITVNVADSEFRDDFDEMTIPVALYKVADVDAAGEFTPVGEFSGMDFSGIDDATTAEEWRGFADTAYTFVENAEPVAVASISREEGSTGAVGASFENLGTGMYLVVPEETFNSDYSVKYVFTPYLTALPSSAYTTTGTGSDDWDYQTEIGLKAEAEQQYGQLDITKVLTNYNESLGRATFVFEVEGRDEAGAVVYSNVVSSTHAGAGTETVTLDRIPAGLDVTVREIYSGASYTVVGSGTATATIVSDERIEATAGTDEAAARAAVSFTNQYDGGNRGGYGVTNHFESDGENGWTWENPTNPRPNPAE